MTTTYQIRAGDTLSEIAGFHNTDLAGLLRMNPQIENPDLIFVGEKINVPEVREEGVSIHAAAAPVESEYPVWYDIALREMDTGVEEIVGPGGHNPRIVEYHQTCSLEATDDETPWCSSFVNWCIVKAGLAGTNSAAARSWLKWGGVLTDPRPGCVVVFSRPPSPTSGHVAFFHEAKGDRILVLGGNQSNQVNITGYPVGRVLGYRWPQ